VTTFGSRDLYLNVMPFRFGGKRFRHKTELDYLCHLQAVVSDKSNIYRMSLCSCGPNFQNMVLIQVEILVKYEQLDYVLVQLEETQKEPRAGTSPLVAVPFRLDLTEDELKSILN
jgi:hypothetical protein